MSGSSELYQLLAARRMCRSYQPQAVPHAILVRILEAARKAPSAGHSQGVRFGVITEAGKRASIASALGEDGYRARGFPPWLSSAPVHLLVGSSASAYSQRYAEPDKQTSPDRWPVPYDVLDGGKALMTLYLAAQQEGLACGYMGPHRAAPATAQVDWPADWHFLGLVTLGYRQPEGERKSASHARGWREFDSVVHWMDGPSS